MRITDLVDVFHGCGKIDLPEQTGLAATWHPIKAISGNTNPAACLPFGKYSVCPYSGGYSSGYGVNRIACEPKQTFLMDRLRLKGFSHFQHSGTGAVGFYYNYAVVTPYYGEKQDFYDIAWETARPGYYAVTLLPDSVGCELTSSRWAAYHRYHFGRSGGCVAVDFENNGLYDEPGLRGDAVDPVVTVCGSRLLTAAVTLQGVRLYFAARFDGPGALDEGGVFRLEDPGAVTVRMSVSAASAADALAESEQATASFDEAAAAAEQTWETALGRIEVDGDETERRLFYSNLYHTLVKPNDWQGGGFLWRGAPFVVDFSTMWDIYKTQLPLVYSLYPEVSAHIVDTIRQLGMTTGCLPNAFLLSGSLAVEAGQARMLMAYTLYDAWKRGVSADWPGVLEAVARDLEREDFRTFRETGYLLRATYTLDMAEVSASLTEMALAFGRRDLAEKLAGLDRHWRNAFDGDGLMRADSEYYEGNRWNYSFRPVRHQEERMALCGGKEGYVNLLDRFFGFTHSEDVSARFEGFNNETDMEAPYAYHAAGRRDRLCRILDTADRQVFRASSGGTGRGGIPGNNDSGGLSACYLWNCLGLFPVSGQDVMLLSRPKFRRAVLHLADGRTLTVLGRQTGEVPGKATWNGTPVPDFRIPASRMMEGGTLIFED